MLVEAWKSRGAPDAAPVSLPSELYEGLDSPSKMPPQGAAQYQFKVHPSFAPRASASAPISVGESLWRHCVGSAGALCVFCTVEA